MDIFATISTQYTDKQRTIFSGLTERERETTFYVAKKEGHLLEDKETVATLKSLPEYPILLGKQGGGNYTTYYKDGLVVLLDGSIWGFDELKNKYELTNSDDAELIWHIIKAETWDDLAKIRSLSDFIAHDIVKGKTYWFTEKDSLLYGKLDDMILISTDEDRLNTIFKTLDSKPLNYFPGVACLDGDLNLELLWGIPKEDKPAKMGFDISGTIDTTDDGDDIQDELDTLTSEDPKNQTDLQYIHDMYGDDILYETYQMIYNEDLGIFIQGQIQEGYTPPKASTLEKRMCSICGEVYLTKEANKVALEEYGDTVCNRCAYAAFEEGEE